MNPDPIQSAADVIAEKKNMLIFTGAGVSVESGIPPFRGAGGLWQQVNPDFFEIDIRPDEKYLLCSDGLSNMVEDDEIRDIVADGDNLGAIVGALVDRANYYGGSDNISVVVLAE